MEQTYVRFFFLLGSLLLLQIPLPAQDIPIVQYEQGKIIGTLPYGRHFYIEGSTQLPNDTRADEVRVRIFRVNRKGNRKKNDKISLTKAEQQAIARDSNLLVNASTWSAFRATDKDRFKTYINTSLKFKRNYLVEFSYLKIFQFNLTDEEKDLALQRGLDRAFKHYQETEGIGTELFGNFLNDEVRRILTEKAAGDYFYTPERIEANMPTIKQTSLNDLESELLAYAVVTGFRSNIDKSRTELLAVQTKLSEIPSDHPDKAAYRKRAQDIQAQIEEDNAILQPLEESLPEASFRRKLEVVKNQLIVVRREYDLQTVFEISKTELNSIQIGSSFGGGAVALNNTNSNFDDLDAFGYTALKFYFSPVDKRIAEPYLGRSFLLDRMSFLLGISTKRNFNFKGQELKSILGITPFLGLSLDVSRYLSVDVGATFFKQESRSPLINDEKIRVGPVLGLNFDFDAFNRVSALVKGEQFKIDPSPNQ